MLGFLFFSIDTFNLLKGPNLELVELIATLLLGLHLQLAVMMVQQFPVLLVQRLRVLMVPQPPVLMVQQPPVLMLRQLLVSLLLQLYTLQLGHTPEPQPHCHFHIYCPYIQFVL